VCLPKSAKFEFLSPKLCTVKQKLSDKKTTFTASLKFTREGCQGHNPSPTHDATHDGAIFS